MTTQPTKRVGTFTATILAAMALVSAARIYAAETEPTFALTQAVPVRSASGRVTLTLSGSFSFENAVQLAIPLTVVVTQGQLTAHLDLAGNVSIGADQPAASPGVISIAARQIVAVLPPQFGAGDAIVQIIATFDGKPLSTNKLHVTL